MWTDWLPLFRLKPHYSIMVACAIALSGELQLSYIALLVAFAYLTAAYGELVNFLHDYKIDVKNPRMKNYAHITGKIQFSSLKKATNLFLLMALASGFALYMIKKEVLLLVILAIHCAYSYSAPPLRLKRYWWGGIITYTPYTATVLLISAVVLGAEIETAGVAAFAFWLGSLSVWTLTNIPDQKYDKSEGVETAALKFGTATCISAYLPLALLSTAVSAALVIHTSGSPYIGVPFLIPAAIGVSAYALMKKEAKHSITKQALNAGFLPYRYNMALVTLSYFLN